MKRVLLDANVLYPANLRNTLMYLTLADAFSAHWTAMIHEEWMRNVLASRPDLTRATLERTRALMDENAREALVEGFELLIETLKLPDANDRHILAAAIHSQCSVILTFNLKDFPTRILQPLGIEAQAPDTFLLSIFADKKWGILAGLRDQRASLRRPPQNASEFLETLARQGLPKFVAALESHASEI